MSEELAFAGAATVPTERAELRPAPPEVLLMLFGAVPLVVGLQLFALVAAAAVIPIFDPAPAAVVLVAFIARPWRGVAVRWLNAACVLAVVMLAEWVPIWVLLGMLVGGTHSSYWPGVAFLYIGIAYLAESVVLLVLVAIGSATSIVGILRAKRELRQETA